MSRVATSLPLALGLCCAVGSVIAADPPMSADEANELLNSSDSCCDALRSALPWKVSSQYTISYGLKQSAYWSQQEEDVRPQCIVSPKTTEDVATAVRLLTLGNDTFPGECNFAVRSGGHTPFAGSANIDKGITIEMSKINQVTPAEDRSTVIVGTGNKWSDVYDVIEPMGILIGGGRASIVGVGGLTLGGGVSYFSPRYGFVCDNIIRFEVVMPSGEIVNATKDENPDLWLALRGGSNNFGIVTNFESTAFEQGEFWGGFVYSDVDTRDAQFAAFEAFTGNPDYDPYAALINSYAYTGLTKSWLVASNYEYTRSPPVKEPKFFENFTAIPNTISTMRISKLSDFADELALPTVIGRREMFITGTYANSAEMMSTIFDIANSTVKELDDITDLIFSMSYQPMPTIITSKAAERGGNSLGLSPDDGNLFNVLLTVSWSGEDNDERIHTKGKALFAEAEKIAKERGLFNKYVYLNYAAEWQDPIGGYGEEVKARLQNTSKKYDPEGVFQKQVPGGFKLFD